MKKMPALLLGLLVLFLPITYASAQTVKATSASKVIIEDADGTRQTIDVDAGGEYTVPEGFSLVRVEGSLTVDFGNGFDVVSTDPNSVVRFFSNPETGEVGVQVQSGQVSVNTVSLDGIPQNATVSAGDEAGNFVAVTPSAGTISAPSPAPAPGFSEGLPPAPDPVVPTPPPPAPADDSSELQDQDRVTDSTDVTTGYFAP